MTLLDESGKPIPVTGAAPTECPICGARGEKNLVSLEMFGGYHKNVCLKCGSTLNEWRDSNAV